MRKIGEKVALVAQICLATIFVIVALLYVLGVIPQGIWQDNAVVFIILLILAAIFVGTSVYLVYMNFSELQNLKRILLYADSKSATTTSLKVVNKIARNCADKIEGVHIKKTKIRADEKKGYTATFVVEISAPSVSPCLEQLRCLIEDSFRDTLGLTFNTITFDVAKIQEPKTDVKKAKKRAQAITDGADQVQDIYQNPTGEKPTDIVMPLPTDEPVDPVTDEQTEVTDEQVDVVASEEPTQSVDVQPTESAYETAVDADVADSQSDGDEESIGE